MTTVSLRFDDETKAELDAMCEDMGMNITTFFTIYAKKALRERRIPFSIEAPEDPFYSKTNQAQLFKAISQVENNQVVVKSFDDLETMANG